MSPAEIDLIIIADRANFETVREYCASAGQNLEQFDRNVLSADFVVMKLSPAKRTCQLAWAPGIGGVLSGLKQLYAGSAEFRLMLTQGSDAQFAVQRALTELGASMIKSGDEPIN